MSGSKNTRNQVARTLAKKESTGQASRYEAAKRMIPLGRQNRLTSDDKKRIEQTYGKPIDIKNLSVKTENGKDIVYDGGKRLGTVNEAYKKLVYSNKENVYKVSPEVESKSVRQLKAAVTAAKKSTKDESRAEHHERVYQAEVRVGEKLKAEYADKVIQEAIRKNKKAFYKFARKTGARS